MLLTAILEKNSSKDLQAEACLALVQQYGRRLEIAERLDNPETFRSFIKAYGQEGDSLTRPMRRCKRSASPRRSSSVRKLPSSH